jgi:hypothetical protein
MDDSSAGDVGVATALGRICALEAKLRQAIQHTHLLSSSFESDPAAADREREALLAIRSATRLVSTVHSYQTSCDLLVILLSDKRYYYCCREQLELLEDKLRDFRCLHDNQFDDKVLCLQCLSATLNSAHTARYGAQHPFTGSRLLLL